MEELSPKKVITVTAIVFVSIAFLWYYFYYTNKSAKIKRLRGEISRLYKYKDELPILMARYKKAQEEFAQYSKKLPLKEEIPTLLMKLNGIIKSQDVELLSFRPGKAYLAKNRLYYIKPINISMRATYVNCGSVFERVAKMKRLFKVKDFSLSNPKIVNSHKVLINVNFSAETYYFKGRTK